MNGISETLKQNNGLLSKQNNQLSDLAGLIRQQTLATIEARREAAQANKAGAAGGPAPADPTKGKGGILGAIGGIFSSIFGFFRNLLSIFSSAGRLFSGILSLASGFIGILGTVFGFFMNIGKYFIGLVKMLDISKIVGFLEPIGAFLMGIGRFLLRFAGPIAAVVGVLTSLEAKDWSAFFGKFTDAFNALLEGDFITAIVNVVTAIPELLIKGVGRLMANIIEFFGFKDAADAIRSFLDTFDLAKIVKDALTFIWDSITGAFKAFTDFFGQFFEGWDIITPIKDAFNWVWEKVTNVFSSMRDAIAEILGFDLIGTIGNAISSVINAVWSFFSELPAKAADFIGSLLPDWVKDTWKKLFGNTKVEAGTPPPNPTPIQPNAAAPSATAPTAQPNPIPNAASVTPQTPALGQTTQGAPAGQTTTTAASTVAPDQAFSNLIGTMVNAVEGRSNLNDVMGAGLGVLGAGTTEFNQRSVNAAAAKETQGSQPVVINNNNNAAPGGGGESPPAQRNSGAARTSVQQSHIDRALYGVAYGAGYA
jgi:hypothetical protein